MKKAIITGTTVDDNFGCSSLLHGVEELLGILFGDDVRSQVYQSVPAPKAVASKEFKSEMICRSIHPSQYMIELMKRKVFKRYKSKPCGDLFQEIEDADYLIDTTGICFCDHLIKDHYSLLAVWKTNVSRYRYALTAKLLRTKAIKNPASFGPMKSKFNLKSAQLVCNRMFDALIAREQESKNQLEALPIRTPIFCSPDVANLMGYRRPENAENRPIGISVSHQIIQQWHSQDSFIDCINALCCHIVKDLHREVLLIPNEFDDKTVYHDVNVAEEIKKGLAVVDCPVQVLDAAALTSTQIKSEIAACEVVVSSRYHTCVAALSSGVPILVIGWHDKYQELLHWYGQEQWILNSDGCSVEQLTRVFDTLWERRQEERRIVEENIPKVRDAIIETARAVYLGGVGK